MSRELNLLWRTFTTPKKVFFTNFFMKKVLTTIYHQPDKHSKVTRATFFNLNQHVYFNDTQSLMTMYMNYIEPRQWTSMPMTFMKESETACLLNFLWPNRGHIINLFILINQGEWIINVRTSTQPIIKCCLVTQYCVERHLPNLMSNVRVCLLSLFQLLYISQYRLIMLVFKWNHFTIHLAGLTDSDREIPLTVWKYTNLITKSICDTKASRNCQ